MKQWIFILLILVSFDVSSQKITVLDNSNLQAIEHVAVVNLQREGTALTDHDGIADLSEFSKSDTLFFQHPSYQEIIIPYAGLKDLNFVINLTKSTVNLSEYVVVASKWEQKKDEVPNKITTIKAKEVAYLNSQTSADLLGSSHEVFIQKSQLGGGSPMIRGFSANSVLIVVDGVRMNNAIFRSGNLQNIISIDANAIDETEVIFGPGSVIYGSDALGGVMDFHTRQVKFSGKSKNLIQGNAMMRYSTANNEKTIHADISYSKKKWGFVTSLTYSDFDDLKMGNNGNDEYRRLHYAERTGNTDIMVNNSESDIQKFSGYSQFNFMQKFSFLLKEKVELQYGFHIANSSNIPRYDRLIQYDDDQSLIYAEWYYGPQLWMMHILGLQLTERRLMYDNAKITFAYQDVEESRHDRKFNKEELRSRTENVDVFSLNFDFDKNLTNKSTLFYGIEGIYNYVGSLAIYRNIINGDTGPESTRYPDGGSDYFTSAAYLNFKSNIREKLTLQAGLRYSYVYALSKFDDNTFFNFPYSEIKLNTGALNGSLGLVYRYSEKSRLNLNLSSGFRAPNIDDLSKVFDSKQGNVVVPNQNLEPEYSYNIDLGLVKHFSSKVKFDITGFYTYITNLMVRRDFLFNGQDSIMYDGTLSKVQAIQNAGSGWIAGLSFDFRAEFSDRISFSTSLTYMKGKDDEEYAIRHVTPLFGSAGLTYSANKIKVDAYIDFSGSISYANLAPSERDKPHIYATDSDGNPYSPAWYTINLKGYYQINNILQVNAGLENILNNRYRPYSSGIVSPGLNFIIALRAYF